MEERQNNLKYIISSLTSLGLTPPIFSTSFPEIDSILESYSQCISLIQKEQKNRQNLSENIQNYQLLIKEISQKCDCQEGKIQETECEISRLQNLINSNNIKNKQERDKLAQDRDNAKKEAAKMSSLCVQHLHDSKKHESAYNKLQEHLRKVMGEKDLLIKNSIEITSGLKNQGLNNEKNRSDEEFAIHMKNSYQNNIKYYSEIIEVLIKTVNDCFNAMKDVLDRLGIKCNWNQLSLEIPDKFNSEIEYRLTSFNNGMKNVEKVKEDEEFPDDSLPYLKNVLQNYKDIIDSNIFMYLKETN